MSLRYDFNHFQLKDTAEILCGFGILNIMQIDAKPAIPIPHTAKQYCQKDGTKNGMISKL